MQAASSVPEVKKLFGMMTNLWKLFYYSPKKAEALEEIQIVLNLPQLKVVKPSDTRWLSHERCIRAIRKDLPALIITLQQLYESSGDAEAYGISTLLANQVGIAGIVLLSQVLDLLARLNTFMQTKTADFSKLPDFLQSVLDELESLKLQNAQWCSDTKSLIVSLEQKHSIIVTKRAGYTRGAMSTDGTDDYRERIAIPYLSALITNIKNRFSNDVVALLEASSIFCPAKLPSKECLSSYGENEIHLLGSFYGKEAVEEYEGTSYTSSPLLNSDDLLCEWKLFRRAMLQEKDKAMKKKSEVPTMQELAATMMHCESYVGIFPETFKLIQIILSLPVGTATVERSFSQMKMIKTRLRNRLGDLNLSRIMRIAIEAPDLKKCKL